MCDQKFGELLTEYKTEDRTKLIYVIKIEEVIAMKTVTMAQDIDEW